MLSALGDGGGGDDDPGDDGGCGCGVYGIRVWLAMAY